MAAHERAQHSWEWLLLERPDNPHVQRAHLEVRSLRGADSVGRPQLRPCRSAPTGGQSSGVCARVNWSCTCDRWGCGLRLWWWLHQSLALIRDGWVVSIPGGWEGEEGSFHWRSLLVSRWWFALRGHVH